MIISCYVIGHSENQNLCITVIETIKNLRCDVTYFALPFHLKSPTQKFKYYKGKHI